MTRSNALPRHRRGSRPAIGLFSLTLLTTGLAAQSTSFDLTAEGWTSVTLGYPNPGNPPVVIGAANSTTHSTTGGNPGGYLRASDANGDTQYWKAPAAYLGNRLAWLGSELNYDIQLLSTGLTYFTQEDIILTGNGITLVHTLGVNPTPNQWVHCHAPLVASAWRVGTAAGPVATTTDLQTVLTNLGSLYIRGEFQLGVEDFAIDNICLAQPFPIDASATSLRTDTSDTPAAPVVIDLMAMGIQAGDRIRMRTVGDYLFTSTGPQGQTSIAIFSTSNTVLAPNNPVRVPSAIACTLPAYTTVNTSIGNLPTDVPLDFAVGPAWVEVQVPGTATLAGRYLIVGVDDQFWGDNSDPEGDLALLVGLVSSSGSGIPGGPPARFDQSDEGWTSVTLGYPVPGNPPVEIGAPAAHNHSITGGNPGGHLWITDPNGDTQYWKAPAGFLGNQSGWYYGSLGYDVKMFATGLTFFTQEDVLMTGNGLTLVHTSGVQPTPNQWVHLSVPFVASAWRVGSRTGPVATPNQLLSVLTNLVALYLRGEFQIGIEDFGIDNVTVSNHQMEWHLASVTGPTARYGSAVAFDNTRGQGVLFGGRGGYNGQYTGLTDTWLYDGQWQRATTAHTPPGRYGHVMAFDSTRQEVVMGFGQTHNFGTMHRDTWLWNGTDWRQANPTTLPPVSVSAAMAFHAATSVCVLQVVSPNQTWEWNGTDWTLRQPSTLPSYGTGSMSYDAARQRTVLMLGISGHTNPLVQHWEWDGTDWSQRTTAIGQQYSSAMFYDASRSQLVFFGGQNYWNNLPFDTWEFDGSNWQIAPTPSRPSARHSISGFYDSWRGHGVMFGGLLTGTASGYIAETWTYSGTAPANIVSYAPACLGPAGLPTIQIVNRPILGDTYEIQVSNLAPNTLTFMMTGWSMASIHIGSLVGVGNGCYLRASPDYQTPMIGTNTYTLGIPNDPVFLGAALHNQAIQLEISGSSLASASVSNAVRMVMGNP